MQEDLARQCALLNAELESLFRQPVWSRPRILQVRRRLDAAQRQWAAALRPPGQGSWHPGAHAAGAARSDAGLRNG